MKKLYEDGNRPFTYYVVDASVEDAFVQYMGEEGACLVKVRFAVPSGDLWHVVPANNEYGFDFVR